MSPLIYAKMKKFGFALFLSSMAAFFCVFGPGMVPCALALEKIFAQHCKKSVVPVEVAMAIAKQESALKPLCINVAGQDYWPETREEAVAIIRKAQKADKSYDVGLMQINSQWIKMWKLDPADLLDPSTNIRYGVRILEDEIKRHGLTWRAIAGYHTPDLFQGRRYAQMVNHRIKGNAELKSRLANPRMAPGETLKLSRKFRNFKFSHVMDNSVLPQVNAQRKPVGMP